MDQKKLVKFCKELGCCDACCFRYMGFKMPKVYENSKKSILKYQDCPTNVKEKERTDSESLKNENAMETSPEVKSSVELLNNSQTSSKSMENAGNDVKSDLVHGNDIKSKENVEETQDILTQSTRIVENEGSKKSKESNMENNQDVLVESIGVAENGDNKFNELNIENNQNVRVESMGQAENQGNEQNMENNPDILLDSTGVAENGRSTPPAKRRKTEICVSCLGILQESSWQECIDMVKEQLDKKRYECNTFACALSSPIAILLREKAITLKIMEKFPQFDGKSITPLKECWKWSFGCALARRVDKALHSGAVCPLLATVTVEYPDDLQELEILKTLAPSLFESRKQQKRRFTVEFTRRCAEQALEGATLEGLSKAGWGEVPHPSTKIKCVSVMCSHSPVYLGGRYVKLSRALPQTPWLVNGTRVMESSVQEIIFQHVANLYDMSPEDVEHRLKFISAGREDVDVRCLGEGRPFAIEIMDPRRELTTTELREVCDQIAKSGQVVVRLLLHVSRDDLSLLKKGEESKTKTYEALCVKLTHSDYDDDDDTDGPPTVSDKDIENINSYRNTEPSSDSLIVLQQRTPIRVLHRRPLLTRTRHIYQLSAHKVAGHPQLFIVRVRTEAGTYMKEWCHGELRRTKPSLGDAIHARVDILALDVASVDLDWPVTKLS